MEIEVGAALPRGFNPLPPPKRGETSPAIGESVPARSVSIHSPRRSEGRRQGHASWAWVRSFNPLPPPKRGETSLLLCIITMPISFNPLPPPKRGETTMEAPFESATVWGFNPLPPPKRGETCRET